MRYSGMRYTDLSTKFASLRQAVIGDHRAPHKPLLVLLMLGRYQRGDYSPLQFEKVQTQLKQLLLEFGPPSRSANVVDPFWRLQNDGIWRVQDKRNGTICETVEPPNTFLLLEKEARGNFAPRIGTALKENPSYIARLGRELLSTNFPTSLHTDIAAAVGLEVAEPSTEAPPTPQLARDAEFRPKIIRAYEHRCAVTGWDLRISNADAGLEAAHIKWHTAGGPSIEQNGIALNALHHKLFDLGAFTLSTDRIPKILVSRDVHGGDFARDMLIGLHGKNIRPPQDNSWLPRGDFIRWHNEEVFKGEARTL